MASREARLHDCCRGCLLGGAVGDALGAPVEFMSLGMIRKRFGSSGITGFEVLYGRGGAITDDTQMALFTAEGLLRSANMAEPLDLCQSGHDALLRWLKTQGVESRHPRFAEATRLDGNGWLLGVRQLHEQRAPGNTCLSALMARRMGTKGDPLNSSKGCGGVMRMAPVGLFFCNPLQAFDIGCHLAATTHGHPSGFLSAGFLAAVVSVLSHSGDIHNALDTAVGELVRQPGHQECLVAVEKAIALTHTGSPTPERVESLGRGWVGEEALSIAIYCVLAAERSFERGVLLAVNHSGDCDSTGAIAGNILGALLGRASIPQRWLDQLELAKEIEMVSDDLLTRDREDKEWARRYPLT